MSAESQALTTTGARIAPKAIKYLWNLYNAPAAAGTEAGASGAAATAGAEGGAATGATNAATGMTAGSWATLAAPLIMMYLKYQAGSGVNEPLLKRVQTQGAGRLISDLLAGKTQDPSNQYSNYNLPPNYAVGSEPWNGPAKVNPYDINTLWTMMHQKGAGAEQPGGTGSSGYTDEQIDTMFGSDRNALAKALGMDSLPDWTKQTYGDWFKQKYLSGSLGENQEVKPGNIDYFSQVDNPVVDPNELKMIRNY